MNECEEQDLKISSQFYQWLSKNVLCFDRLTPDQISQLFTYYKQLVECKDVWSHTMDMALTSKSGVDFVNDIEKNSEQMDIARDQLNQYIEQLNQQYGVSLENKEERTK